MIGEWREKIKPYFLAGRGEGWLVCQIVLFLFYIVIPSFRPFWFPTWLTFPGFLVLPFGVYFIVSGLKNLGDHISPFPVPSQGNQLIQSGAYRFVRHPVYLGILVCLFGYAVWRSHVGKLLIAGATCFLLNAKATFEEQKLSEIHTNYEDYKQRVKKLIPFIY